VPDWIPETKAALLHHGKVIAKKQDDYVTTAATAPQLRKCLIKKSKRHNPLIEQDLQISIGKACNPPCFSHLTKGRQFQLAKYSHNWTPTLHQCATQDNSID
jgi:hypothetical protein